MSRAGVMLLALDTAGPFCAVALATLQDGQINCHARREVEIGRGHAERLFPLIEECLADASVDYSDLTAVATTLGPGSFTGIRIGVAAARGLALALQIPALGVDVLEALCEGVRHGEAAHRAAGLVAAILDAGRGNVFLRMEEISSREEIIASQREVQDEAAAFLAPYAFEGLVVCGAGANGIAGMLAADGLPAIVADARPSADIAMVARLALSGHAVSPPAPLYLRPPDAKPQTDKSLRRRLKTS
ncbi:tRNA (adenosine(37)-N6)-threonylcarbamoyltransferase complex dimerization subunit type 1 TsaB [Afifella sp. JA880]|uniref:tRNA (adenosine(37)-N6)-threonylcarbamoyltransferase complex dimerization subunit type 1 TsaB n=1 Tax=Afifella sp. JA880 TaxID=2975280 RepID=UPI0021BB24DA|nr:tRNA (adenosine(37)-N6)-threonylcarbamoyltransferase complex dimerization subunit type 1 TsaB [Afifella sp. JA880]MCT8268854.1 tRNA (adenosine(37)-N6)-threonylcarbamoyltransferase complex dimerization subunit type 1 TsaB [Afifella sp. JA880]